MTAALESEDATFLGADAFFDDLEADLAGDFCGTSSPFLPALALAAAFFVGVFLPFFGDDAWSTVACLSVSVHLRNSSSVGSRSCSSM